MLPSARTIAVMFLLLVAGVVHAQPVSGDVTYIIPENRHRSFMVVQDVLAFVEACTVAVPVDDLPRMTETTMKVRLQEPFRLQNEALSDVPPVVRIYLVSTARLFENYRLGIYVVDEADQIYALSKYTAGSGITGIMALLDDAGRPRESTSRP